MSRYSLPFWVAPARTAGEMSYEEVQIAREKGRLGAAYRYRDCPELREEGERRFGKERMRMTYPEAYENTNRRFIDRMLFWH